MMSGDPRASLVFEKDVEDTYNHLCERVRISKAEEDAVAAGTEQIQLVPENPEHTITFNVPDGPPPENIQLEGEELKDVDPEAVRKALQMRWNVFQSFKPELRAALESQSLEKVNKVLGSMKVIDAEEVVKMLDMAGILNFSEHGVRDGTGQEGDAPEDSEDGDTEEELEDAEEGEHEAGPSTSAQ